MLPIPFTDYEHEIPKQVYDFVAAPPHQNIEPGIGILSAAKIAFYREETTLFARIFPVPEQAGVIYTVDHAIGRREWGEYDWPDGPPFQEYSRFKVIHAALSLLPHCKWEARDEQDSARYRPELRSSLGDEYAIQDEEFTSHLQTIVNEPVSDSGYWYE